MKTLNERVVVLLVAAAQFVNILDFVIVMPLGPDFAKALSVPVSELGVIGGSYTAAAAVSGLVGVFFLDRLDRRPALAFSLFGLGISTALAATATGLGSLVAARVLAGLFGGPATSVSFSIVADVVPAERRGRAMGTVMGAFSIASVVGVPAGLKLAEIGSWRWPFIGVAVLCIGASIGVALLLPPMRGHLTGGPPRAPLASLLMLVRNPLVGLSLAMTAVTMSAGFIVIPNIAGHLQMNLGFPRERLHLVYFVGGIASLLSMRAAGLLNDRAGAFRTGTIGAIVLAVVVYLGFAEPHPHVPVLPTLTVFFVAMAFRNVSHSTLTSKVPAAGERASFTSLQSAVQHLAAAAGAFASSRMLSDVGGRLVGMPRVAWTSITLTLALPLLFHAVESRVRARAV